MNPSDSFPKLSFVCPKLWTEMHGDDRTRFCDACGHHIYNLSAMTVEERTSLRRNAAGRICVTYQRRLNGEFVTPENQLTAYERSRARQAGAVALSAAALALVSGCVSKPDAPSAPPPAVTGPSTPEDEVVILTGFWIEEPPPSPHQKKSP